jgi:hypothetical protein
MTIMFGLVAFILITLALARTTRAVVADRVGLPLRRWAVNRYGEQSGLAFALHCPWCVSMWLAAPAAVFWTLLALPPDLWWLCLPAWPGISYLVGLLSRLEGGV